MKAHSKSVKLAIGNGRPTEAAAFRKEIRLEVDRATIIKPWRPEEHKAVYTPYTGTFGGQ
jgi:hypothetical protein